MDTGTYMPPRVDGKSDVRIRLEHGVVPQGADLAPWVVVGHCKRCGMPLFVNRERVRGDRPPYVYRTCRCFQRSKSYRSRRQLSRRS